MSSLDTQVTWYEKFAINVVRSVSMPQHMAYIMDGNRRYAENIEIQRHAGISLGFERFVEVNEWSVLLGIKEITVYALSLENFKRSTVEVDFIFKLMETKFDLFLNNLDYYLRNGIRFNIIGNLTLLPERLQVLSLKVMQATEKCKVIQINIAIAYTSREEICSTIKRILNDVQNNKINVNDIDEQYITRSLYTRESPEVDLMIRTSGETRLSDFLLWQSTSSKLLFIETLWPAITLGQIIYQLFYYQRSKLHDQFVKKVNLNEMKNYVGFARMHSLFDKFIKQAVQKLKKMFHVIK